MKNRFVAAVFAWFLGGIGINSFYTGHTVRGVCGHSFLLDWNSRTGESDQSMLLSLAGQ